MAKSPEQKPPTAMASEPQHLEDDIRRRAYQFYEERGREEGHDLEDWLRAEEEITEEKKIHPIAA
jgi:hypothetical protein